MARSQARSRGRKSKRADRSGPGAAGNQATGRVTPKASARYTPPIPRDQKVSPTWYPYLIVGLLVIGLLCIVLNYLGVFPGGASNWYLLIGLVLIAVGFLAATGYR